MAHGHGSQPWPLAMASPTSGHSPWPWSQWPWPVAMVHSHGRWPWPLWPWPLWPWPLAIGHGPWLFGHWLGGGHLSWAFRAKNKIVFYLSRKGGRHPSESKHIDVLFDSEGWRVESQAARRAVACESTRRPSESSKKSFFSLTRKDCDHPSESNKK